MRSAVLLVLGLALLVLCCAPRALTPTVSGASVVTLVAPSVMLDDDGVEPAPPRWAPFCNAFAVDAPRVPGGVLLLTAGHCVRPVNGVARYLSPNGIGHSRALRWATWGGDVAALLPLEPGRLRALPTAAAPEAGAKVEAVSSLYETSVRGAVLASLGSGRVAVSLPLERGWSGSPVIDASGAAWGVVTACQAEQASALEGDLRCVGDAIVAALTPEVE